MHALDTSQGHSWLTDRRHLSLLTFHRNSKAKQSRKEGQEAAPALAQVMKRDHSPCWQDTCRIKHLIPSCEGVKNKDVVVGWHSSIPHPKVGQVEGTGRAEVRKLGGGIDKVGSVAMATWLSPIPVL